MPPLPDFLPPALGATLRPGDAAALALLGLLWLGLGRLAEHPPVGHPSVTVLMAEVRRAWLREFLRRSNRIFDAQIVASLRQGTAFFASTALLAVGGVLALIGNVAPLAGLAEEIAREEVPPILWQIRLVPAALLLTHAFLKFAWANRVFGHASVMMAAVPEDAGDPAALPRAARAAELMNRAALNFSRGLRSLYFALASLAWVGGPLALALGAGLVTLFLARREFASVPRDVLARRDPD